MLIFSRAAMTWRRHVPKTQCATIRLSCWQSAFSQPAMRSPGGLSQHRQAWHGHSNYNPDLRASNLRDFAPFRRAEDFAMFANGLRKAGLPE